jgi:hypothetical protein
MPFLTGVEYSPQHTGVVTSSGQWPASFDFSSSTIQDPTGRDGTAAADIANLVKCIFVGIFSPDNDVYASGTGWTCNGSLLTQTFTSDSVATDDGVLSLLWMPLPDTVWDTEYVLDIPIGAGNIYEKTIFGAVLVYDKRDLPPNTAFQGAGAVSPDGVVTDGAQSSNYVQVTTDLVDTSIPPPTVWSVVRAVMCVAYYKNISTLVGASIDPELAEGAPIVAMDITSDADNGSADTRIIAMRLLTAQAPSPGQMEATDTFSWTGYNLDTSDVVIDALPDIYALAQLGDYLIVGTPSDSSHPSLALRLLKVKAEELPYQLHKRML